MAEGLQAEESQLRTHEGVGCVGEGEAGQTS